MSATSLAPATGNWLSKVVSAGFYLTINLGAFVSMLLVPWLLKTYGASVAFLVPGLLMLLATVIFWSGRYRFVHIPAAGMGFVREALSGEGLRCLGRLSGIYLFHRDVLGLIRPKRFVLVLQAQQMDRLVFARGDLALADSSRQSAANRAARAVVLPVFIPGAGQVCAAGLSEQDRHRLFITVLSFALVAGIQTRIDAGFHPSISAGSCWLTCC